MVLPLFSWLVQFFLGSSGSLLLSIMQIASIFWLSNTHFSHHWYKHFYFLTQIIFNLIKLIERNYDISNVELVLWNPLKNTFCSVLYDMVHVIFFNRYWVKLKVILFMIKLDLQTKKSTNNQYYIFISKNNVLVKGHVYY